MSEAVRVGVRDIAKFFLLSSNQNSLIERILSKFANYVVK